MARSSGQAGQMPKILETSKRDRSREINFARCRSFAWDRAFFTNDGLLDDEELESITEGGEKDAKHQLEGIEEKLRKSMDSISTTESDNLALEAKLLEEMEASTKKSSTSKLTNSRIKMSSGEGDSKPKASHSSQKGTQATSKVTGAPHRATRSSSLGSSTPIRKEPTRSSSLGGSSGSSSGNIKSSAAMVRRSTSSKTGKVTTDSTSNPPIKTEPTRSSPLGSSSGSPSGYNFKTSVAVARRSTSSETGKAAADSTSKTPPGTHTKNKMQPINSGHPSQVIVSKLSPRKSPASPTSQWSPGSSSSISRPKRSSSTSRVPQRSMVNNEKSSATNARKDDQKIGKPAIVKSQSSISLKNKPRPVFSNSSSSGSLGSSACQRSTESSSSSQTVNQRSISRGNRGTSVHYKSSTHDASVKSTLKNHPSSQTQDQNGRQPAALCPQTSSKFRPSVQSTGRRTPSTKSGFFEEGKSYKSCLMAGLPITQSKSGSSNGAKAPSPKPVAAVKSSSQKKQSSAKNLLLVSSPEVLDIKGKIHALKMEISNKKKEKSMAVEGKSTMKQGE